MSRNRLYFDAAVIAVSAIVFIISAIIALGQINGCWDGNGGFTVALISFAIGAVTLFRLSWRCAK